MRVSLKFLKFKPRGLKHLKGKGDILARVEEPARDFVKSELKRPLKFKR